MSLNKPSTSEDEYFALEDAEKKRRLSLAQVKNTAQAERDRLKALHHMHCPKCGMQLQELAFQGVSVDRCFSCHGIFLDEGELDKLLGKKEDGYWSRMMGFFARKEFAGE